MDKTTTELIDLDFEVRTLLKEFDLSTHEQIKAFAKEKDIPKDIIEVILEGDMVGKDTYKYILQQLKIS